MNTPPTSTQSDLGWILETFIEKLGFGSRAVLGSRDGVIRLYAGTDKEEAEHAAARMSGVAALQRGVPKGLTTPQDPISVIQNLAEVGYGGERVFELIRDAGYGSLLGVRVAGDADVGHIAFEMGELIKRMAPYLSTPDRVLPAAAAADQ